MSAMLREYTAKKHLESYGSIYLDVYGNESEQALPMTLETAKRIAKRHCGFIEIIRE
jgi:hypothetical protein